MGDINILTMCMFANILMLIFQWRGVGTYYDGGRRDVVYDGEGKWL